MEEKIKLGENFEIDLDKLISTRMLIQANSGAGKSYAIRKLLEESHGKVQQIVIDLEGEFASLREKYDYLLVGPDGEIPARIQTAELLARKLLKLNVSTIIDLSELKHHERILFVKRFIDSLVNAPKDLWHPCLVMIDEAHQFCPEKAKSESGSSVIDLCTRGRKRGYCAVLATQRISKLNKDAAAECNNQMVGRTSLDIDQKRAADILGITNKEEIRNLRNMDDGEFQAFGPAIGRDVKKIQVDKTKTIHLDSKHVTTAPTPTPDNIKKIMKDVIDLPKEAADELKNLTDYKNKVTELKREVRRLENSQSKPLIKVDEKALEKAHRFGFAESEKQWNEKWKEVVCIQKNLKYAHDFIKNFMDHGSKIINVKVPDVPQIRPRLDPNMTPMSRNVPQCPANIHSIPIQIPKVTQLLDEDIKLSPAYMRLLRSAAMFYPDEITKAKLSILSDVPQKASTFRNGLSKLKTTGLITSNNGTVRCTEEGLNIAGDVEHIPTDPDKLVNMWCAKLSPAYEKMFRCIVERYPNQISKEELSLESEVPIDASTFRNGLSKIKTLGLIKVNSGMINASPELFE